MTRRPATDEGRLVETRIVARRAAMLLAGGAQPSMLWKLLEDDEHAGSLAAHVVATQAQGGSIPKALSERGHNSIAAVWEVAEKLGSPMAVALDRLALHADAMLTALRDRRSAFAGPRSTTSLVTALPLLALAMSFALGFNPLAEIVRSPAGWGMALLGVALMVAGRLWSRRLLQRAEGNRHTPGYTHELMAIAVTGGCSVHQARLQATTALDRYPVEGASLTDFSRDGQGISRLISVAERAGVPMTDVLRAEADALRAEYSATAQVNAAKLSITLLLPLGICVLPAFILLGVIPMLFSVFNENLIAG